VTATATADVKSAPSDGNAPSAIGPDAETDAGAKGHGGPEGPTPRATAAPRAKPDGSAAPEETIF
jgi:hypothetical protein